jgi:hypothetical protein
MQLEESITSLDLSAYAGEVQLQLKDGITGKVKEEMNLHNDLTDAAKRYFNWHIKEAMFKYAPVWPQNTLSQSYLTEPAFPFEVLYLLDVQREVPLTDASLKPAEVIGWSDRYSSVSSYGDTTRGRFNPINTAYDLWNHKGPSSMLQSYLWDMGQGVGTFNTIGLGSSYAGRANTYNIYSTNQGNWQSDTYYKTWGMPKADFLQRRAVYGLSTTGYPAHSMRVTLPSGKVIIVRSGTYSNGYSTFYNDDWSYLKTNQVIDASYMSAQQGLVGYDPVNDYFYFNYMNSTSYLSKGRIADDGTWTFVNRKVLNLSWRAFYNDVDQHFYFYKNFNDPVYKAPLATIEAVAAGAAVPVTTYTALPSIGTAVSALARFGGTYGSTSTSPMSMAYDKATSQWLVHPNSSQYLFILSSDMTTVKDVLCMVSNTSELMQGFYLGDPAGFGACTTSYLYYTLAHAGLGTRVKLPAPITKGTNDILGVKYTLNFDF